MRFDQDATGALMLTDVDEAAVFADSQLDYPGRDDGTGWHFMAQDKAGGFTPLQQRERGLEWTTRDAFRIGTLDQYCRLGRDMSHPGYEQWPALVWTAPFDRLIDLSGEVAVTRPEAPEHGLIAIELGGQPIWSAQHAFPEIVRFRLTLHVKRDERLVVALRAKKIINSLIAIHYCWVTDAGAPPATRSAPFVGMVSRTVLDASWAAMTETVAEITGAPADEARRIAYADPRTHFDLAKPLASAITNPVARRQGDSRYFSVDQVKP